MFIPETFQAEKEEAGYLLKHMKTQDTVLVITRCILMELASHSGILNQEYMEYIKYIREYGIPVVVLYEEDIFFIMEMVFNTNAAINNYLCWAVRLLKGPVSTITYTIENNAEINKEVMQGKNLNSKEIYRHFLQQYEKIKNRAITLVRKYWLFVFIFWQIFPEKQMKSFMLLRMIKAQLVK